MVNERICRHEVLKAFHILYKACKSNVKTCNGCYIRHSCQYMLPAYEFSEYGVVSGDLISTNHSFERMMTYQEMKDNLDYLYDHIMKNDLKPLCLKEGDIIG